MDPKFQPNNRILGYSEEQRPNVFWRSEFSTLDRESIGGLSGFLRSLEYYCANGLDRVGDLSVGDNVAGIAALWGTRKDRVLGTIEAFAAKARNTETIEFHARIKLDQPLYLPSGVVFTVFLPIDDLNKAS